MNFLTQLILRVATISIGILIALSSSAYALPALTSPQSPTNSPTNSNSSPNGPAAPNSTSTERIDNNQPGIVEASTARIALTVVDQKDKPVEKAKATLDKKEAVTDKAGLAVFSDIQPGKQAVKINKSGKITNASINVVNQKDMSLTQRFTIRAQTPYKFPYLLVAGILIIAAAIATSYWKSQKVR